MSYKALTDAISAWQAKLEDWRSEGLLESSMSSAFRLSSDELHQAQSQTGVLSNPINAKVQILSDESLGGLLGAYAPSTKSIYLNEKLTEDLDLATHVLTHELGHYLTDELDLGYLDHAYISYFVEKLLPGSSQRATASPLSIGNQENARQVVLPGGETLAVQQFATSIHNNFTGQVLPFLSKEGMNLLNSTQAMIDDPFGTTSLSLQYKSYQHFDNNNISGSTAAIRRWYENGLERFNDEAIRLSTDKVNGLVNPSFIKPIPSSPVGSIQNDLVKSLTEWQVSDPGVAHLLWRFGQVVHALQDFYAHSNWVELVQAGMSERGSILLEGKDYPNVLRPGQSLSNNTIVAEKGGNYDSYYWFGHGTGYSSSSEKSDIWFQIASDDSQANKPKGTAWAVGKVYFGPNVVPKDTPIGAVMTGATSEFLYKDPILSMATVDKTKNAGDGVWFQGLDHGGLAGVRNSYSYVGPMNKDDPSHRLHRQAQAYSALQLQNEWDRLGNLINRRYGAEGLKRFADFAVSEQNRQLYIDTYRRGGIWNWQYVKTFELASSADHYHNSLGLEPESEYDSTSYSSDQSIPPVRVIEVFKKDASIPESNGSYLKLQFQTSEGQWVDSALESFDIHHDDLSPEDLALLAKPSTSQHIAAGERASWISRSSGDTDINGTIFYIESANKDVEILIDTFDIASDKIVIVRPDGSGLKLPNRYYGYNGFQKLKGLLKAKYNVDISATPVRDGASSTWHLSRQDIAQAGNSLLEDIGPSSRLVLTASDLFDDPNVIVMGMTSRSNSAESSLESRLYFSDYDDSLPFLRLTDGKLVASSNIGQYAGKSYQALVSVSDGKSVLGEELIQVSIAPEIIVSEDSNGVFDANQLFSVTLPDALEGVYSIVLELSSADPSMPNYMATIVSHIDGLSEVATSSERYVTLGSETESGSARFWLQANESSDLKPLMVRMTDGRGFTLYDSDNQLFAELKPVDKTADKLVSLEDYEIQDENWSKFGFLYTPVEKRSLSLEVSSNSQKRRSVGLFMTDAVTGAIVNPKTGKLADLNSESAPDLVDAWAVFSKKIPLSGKATFLPTTEWSSEIDYDNIVWSPYVKQRENGKAAYYFVDSYLNTDGLAHGLKLSDNSIGFDTSVAQASPAFNDVIVAITYQALPSL